ncbi:hypothetical protein Slin15195_G061540 [Septoria linicola]|uniref:DUF6590 domain-containing protein n=1 Tax=Septoria linicola TaxID=215465 RepID=A0A9Q9APS3_9PEZI|nr:hypothetical protein Slin15195_G061540 [Septoria linicola]
MSGPGNNAGKSPIQWFRDPTRDNALYYVDPDTFDYVYENGGRISNSAPRSSGPTAPVYHRSEDSFAASSSASPAYRTTSTIHRTNNEFSVRDREYFRKYRVLAIQGTHAGHTSDNATIAFSGLIPGRDGPDAQNPGVQRFVVVAPAGRHDDHCYALSISSNGGHGAAKPGVMKHEQGVIYTGDLPSAQRSENPSREELRRAREESRSASLLPNPIEVRTTMPDEKLHSMSRIDYGQIQHVPLSSLVHDIGMVSRDSQGLLDSQYSQVQRWRSEAAWRDRATRMQGAYDRLRSQGFTQSQAFGQVLAAYQNENPSMPDGTAEDYVARLLAHGRR